MRINAEQTLTDDRLFRGALALMQPARGHRAGTDAVLLVSTTPVEAIRIADLGASSGMVGLRAAQMNAAARVTLIEHDPAMVALATRNIAANGLGERVEAAEADAFHLGRHTAWREAFDLVLTNPPFFTAGRNRVSPDPHRRAAHVLEGDLDGWLRNAATVLQPRGRLIMIHRGDALMDILPAVQRRFGGIRLVFIHPRADQPAHRVLVAGCKGSRAGLVVLPPLVLGRAEGFTPEAAALHDGEARLDMTKGGLSRPSSEIVASAQ
jgi:tRNA1(Val) A37 N6-methylase TrmN6